MKDDQVREHLSRLMYVCLWDLTGCTHQVLRELSNITVMPLRIISEWSYWSGKVPEDWKEANATSVFRKGEEEGLR